MHIYIELNLYILSGLVLEEIYGDYFFIWKGVRKNMRFNTGKRSLFLEHCCTNIFYAILPTFCGSIQFKKSYLGAFVFNHSGIIGPE